MFNSVVQNFRLDSRVSLQRRAGFLALAALVLGFIVATNAGCVIGLGRGSMAGHGRLGGHCHDCDGMVGGLAGRPLIYGPLNRLRNLGSCLTCGLGCGEVYAGEWTSTPPDACDPCGSDYCGGGSCGTGVFPCRPICWHPGRILSSLRWSGRFYDGMPLEDCLGDCVGDCGCGGEFVEDYFQEDYLQEEGVIEGPVYHQQIEGHSSRSGCSHCSRTASRGGRTIDYGRMSQTVHPGRSAKHARNSAGQTAFGPQTRRPSGVTSRPSQMRPALPRTAGETLVR